MANTDGGTEQDFHERGDRRKMASNILWWLLASVMILSGLLFIAARYLGGDIPPQVQGIVLTALAGAVSALLSFIGLIVKGFVDNLTGGR